MGRAASSFAVVAALALATGCGSGSDDDTPAHLGTDLGVDVRLADCADWEQGTIGERLGTIREIRNVTGGPVSGTDAHGATLADEDAYDLFERFCEEGFARGFKLYKLYTRAAAFQSLSGD